MVSTTSMRCKSCNSHRDVASGRSCDLCRERSRQKAAERRDKQRLDGTAKAYNRRNGLQTKFRMSIEEYETLHKRQGGMCAACGNPETALSTDGMSVRCLAVDHDHACCPGKKSCGRCIRGLLCNRCNVMVGMALDDPARLDRAAAYLRRYETVS